MKRPTAAKELLRRRLIRRDLTEWGRYKGYEPAPHHRLICWEIDAFLSSDDEVLLLFAPPGSAKSTWLSVLFPSHYLARFPKNSILAATHSVCRPISGIARSNPQCVTPSWRQAGSRTCGGEAALARSRSVIAEP